MGSISRILQRRGSVSALKALGERLKAKAIAAARRNNAALYFSDVPVLGPELVSNGTFDSDTGWTKGPNVTISGGIASTTGTTNFGVLVEKSGITLQAGKSYLCSIKSNKTSGSGLAVGFNASNIITGVTSSQTYSNVFTPATTQTASLYVIETSGGTFVGSVDDVSIREILNASPYGYQDSAGTLPSYLGGTLGLWLDRSYGGELGAELVSNGDFSNGTTGWIASAPASNVGGATLSVTGGVLRVTNDATGINFGVGSYAISTVVGKTYTATVSKVASSLTPNYWHIGTASNGSFVNNILANLTGSTATFVATATTTYISLGACNNTANAWAEWDNISVREVKGTHLTQATVANRPTMARVPKKLGPNLVVNGDGSSADGWAGTYGGTVASVSGEFVVTSQGSAYAGLSRPVTLEAGKSYVFSYKVVDASQSLGVYGFIAQNYLGDTNRSLSFGPHTASGTYSTTFVAGYSGGSYVSASAGAGGLVAGETIKFDNIEVREVLEWTNAPSFDGGDSLTSPVNTGASGTLVSAFKPTAIIWEMAISSGAQLANNAGVRLGINANKYLFETCNGVSATQAIGSSAPANTPVVLSADFTSGGVTRLFENGVQTASATNYAGTSGFGTCVGSGLYGTGTKGDYFQGPISLACIAPSVMPDADRKDIERFGAYLSSLNYLG